MCAQLLKRLRRRGEWRTQLIVILVLSLIAGLVSGGQLMTDPTFMIISAVLYATYVATLSIDTLQQGAENELFQHETAGGVRPTAVALARIVGDLLVWWPLPLLFGIPYAGLINWVSLYVCNVCGLINWVSL